MMKANFFESGTKTISIGSGKGGVGKTTLAINLAWSLAQKGQRVLIYDADFGLSNVEIMMNIKPQGSVFDVLQGDKELQEIITPVAKNIDLVSSGSGIVELHRLSLFERRNLVAAFEVLNRAYDYLIVDTSPGISDNVLHVSSATQMSAVIVTPDPSSITDSYALIKLLHQECKVNKVAIICNQVRDEYDGLALFQRFSDVTNRFLNINLDYWGSVNYDAAVKRSTIHQRLILKQEPLIETSQRILKISDNLEKSLAVERPQSGLSFFMETAIGVA